MNTSESVRTRHGSRGQILVIVAGGFLALIAGVALVIDGGNAFAQQRATQNGADASAEAGTVVIAQYLMAGSPSTGAIGTCPSTPTSAWDLEVCQAVYGAASNNGVEIETAEYTDYRGDSIGTVGAGFPAGAQGIRTVTSREFSTYFARAIGISTFTTRTQATAVTGTVTTLCPPGTPCALFPITVPYEVSLCSDSGKVVVGGGDWPYLGDADTTPENEANVPICKNQETEEIGGGSAGSVGWLDLTTALGASTEGACGTSFKDAVTNPCAVSVPFPTWIQTFPGAVGKGGPEIQETLNAFHGDVVTIPLFDGTCKVKPGGTSKDDCPADQIGVGVNTWYHVPNFANFKLDYFWISGADRKKCEELPGSPLGGGKGENGCMKGWWVVALSAPGAVTPGPVTPSTTNQLGVQLIR